MSVYNESKTTRTGMYGISVARITDGLPNSESSTIFNVVGGRISITQIIGEVTTAIQDQANNLKLQFTPTGGSAVDLCDTVDIANDAVGIMYSMTGVQEYALQKSSVLIKQQQQQIIVNEGAISINCSADNTGAIKWTIYYIAMDDGAYITAGDPYTTTAGA